MGFEIRAGGSGGPSALWSLPSFIHSPTHELRLFVHGGADSPYNSDTMSQPAAPIQSDIQELPEVISTEFLAILRQFGVIEAKLFGSVARGDARPDSDIDLLVTFDHQVSLFRQMDLTAELSRLSGRKIDLITNIDPAFAPYIVPTLVPLPL